MTTFQGLTATQWRNRINEYNPGMYSKEFLKNKTAKELAHIQNGKSYGVSGSKSAAESKPMSAIRSASSMTTCFTSSKVNSPCSMRSSSLPAHATSMSTPFANALRCGP